MTATLPSKRIGPLPVEVHRAGPGHYVAGGVPLSPAGDWRLRVTSRVSDFDQHEATVEVPVE